ncbi:MAG: penicillin-binding protein 2 [Clostridia bacterium]|nr:penicillin-binding protein 2 [Clostridia bacterium]
MHKNRPIILCLIFFALIGLLIVKIAYLQLYSGEKLSRAAASQRSASTELEKPRGDILDRNGIPLTHRSKTASVVLKPLFIRGKDDKIDTISRILKVDAAKIKREVDAKREPVIIEADYEKVQKILEQGIEGVSVVYSLKRYDDNTVGRHILGYLNKADQVGEAGVEKFFNEVLRYKEDSLFSVFTDARQNLIQGLGYRINKTQNGSKQNIRLTMDYHIQKIVEEVMDRNHIKGAVIVEDIYSGDILAMASKPDFKPNDVFPYLNSHNNELFNRAVASYNLGSIFKIIDAACKLEDGRNDRSWYECTGSITIGDKEFKCSAYEKGGHGWINFEDAFSKSCNPYFISMGLELGAEEVLRMAKEFGLGGSTGIRDQGVDEASGNLPANIKRLLDGDIANISIGQGNVMATPLQVADIIATVANGGIKNKINIVDCIIDSAGSITKEVRRNEGKRIITKKTSNKLMQMMEMVTNSGTGTKAEMADYGGAGGKTGSAETGQFNHGEKVVHAWFAGYFPRKSPRYSVAVFVEDGKNGGQTAAPIFAEVAVEMIKKGY